MTWLNQVNSHVTFLSVMLVQDNVNAYVCVVAQT